MKFVILLAGLMSTVAMADTQQNACAQFDSMKVTASLNDSYDAVKSEKIADGSTLTCVESYDKACYCFIGPGPSLS
jgi:hypothetical protein